MKKFIHNILLEGRKDTINKWRPKFEDAVDFDLFSEFTGHDVHSFDDFVRHIESGLVHQKYLDFALRTSDEQDADFPIDDIIYYVNIFHKLSESNMIDDKDIYSPIYKDVEKFVDIVDFGNTQLAKKGIQKKAEKNAKKIFEDEDFMVLKPLSYESSCVYGGGTKWCTASRDTNQHWHDYTRKGDLYYIIDKHRKENHPLYKVALHWDKSKMTAEIFNAPDKQIGNGRIEVLQQFFPQDIYDSIYNDIFPKKRDTNKESKILQAELADMGWKYKMWDIHWESTNGVAHFYHRNLKEGEVYFDGLATPFWDEPDTIPIQVEVDDNSSGFHGFESVGKIEIPSFANDTDAHDWYREEYPRLVVGELEVWMIDNLSDETMAKVMGEDTEVINENDFDWVNDVSSYEDLNICEAYIDVNVGDEILIYDMKDNFGLVFDAIECEVLWKGRLKGIDPTNNSNKETVVFRVSDDDFMGFDDDWISSWSDDDIIKQCDDGRCYQISCGDVGSGDQNLRVDITKQKGLNEADFGWVDDVPRGPSDNLKEFLSDGKDHVFIPINRDGEPYLRRGKPAYYYMSTSPYWWFRFKGVPDSQGRSGWFEREYRGNEVAIIMPDWDIQNPSENPRDFSNDELSAITDDIPRFDMNFTGDPNYKGERAVLMGRDGKPDYSLNPKWFEDLVRPNLEKYFGEH